MKFLLGLLLASAAWAQLSLTTITDTIYKPDGTKFRGSVYITSQAFNQGAIHVDGVNKEVIVGSNGVFTVQLAPNVGATPTDTAYRVRYQLQNGVVRDASWTVPVSLTPLNISSVEGPVRLTQPSPVIATTQIGAGTAAAGQAICFNGLSYLPGNCATTGGVSLAAPLTFGTIQDGGTKDLTFTFSGISSGQAFVPGLPSGLPTGVQGFMLASAADTIKVRLLNLSGVPVTIGALTFSSTIIAGSISGSGSLTFPSINVGTCAYRTFSLPGALQNGTVVPGFPAALEVGLFPAMRLSAAGTAQVILCNWGEHAITPAVATYSAKIP